jgi:hypothetical protein
MEKETKIGIRVGFEWACGGGCVIALIAGNGTLERTSILALAVFGTVAFSVAILEHGWHKSSSIPRSYVRASIILLLICACMAFLGYKVWPKEKVQQPKIAPLITWNPSPIESGVALSEKQLNAKATVNGSNVDGDFVYNPTFGSTLTVGVDTLSLVFTPKDSTTYAQQTKTVAITVRPDDLPKNPPAKTSFAFVLPGGTTTDNQWIFVIGHRGPEPNMNVAIEFVDDVAHILPNTSLALMMRLLNYPEVDPKGRGSILALEFLWKPPVFGHESYSVTITSRERTVDEKLQIERVDSKWFYDVQITDRDSKGILMDCQDRGFPRPRKAPHSCFPDIVKLE